ncbi:hypothetical protein [Streptomyces cucumeris]|uniref:hypothetical protein n=1 Tax=Streptomyces cucumeris TaxID=2962890 RepID=UPI0020C9337D|nr:hypothetical protein [Streptomyces sp. NEAU-Y11]MCP9209546.1 hypothetical protein [Streptomyces sp. NEAU-Y11]
MPTYGYRLHLTAPGMTEGTYGVRNMEVSAPDRRTADAMIDGWAAVEGEAIVDRELIADGITFREHMMCELVSLGARMSLRYGVSTDGPITWKDGNGETRAAMRLWCPNGRGVSLSSKLDESGFIHSEFAAIREDATDRHGWVFDGAGVQEYPERTAVGNGQDEEISALLARLAALPRK